LQRPLLVGRDHGDALGGGVINLGVLVGPHPVAEPIKAMRQLGPEGEAGAHRDVGVNRTERAHVLGHDLALDAARLD
jgi:hypothetical protein